jgi:NTE family protein
MKSRCLNVLLLLLIAIPGSSHEPDSAIRNLVFEGAGIRGIAYAGVIESLEGAGIMSNIERVGGTSAGAITAAMLSVGYSSEEIIEVISKMKLQKFNDGKFLFIGGISRTRKKFGWYRGEKFAKWMGQVLEQKTGNSDITFRELHEGNYKDLYVVGTSLSKQKAVILSYETYPEMRVKDAVRISMSIPLYYQAVFVDSVGNVYKRQNEAKNLDVMVDGGIIGNFPIYLFDSTGVDSLGNEIRIPNRQTLGVRIDSEEQIRNDTLERELAPHNIVSLNDYFTAFYVMVIENLNRVNLTDSDWSRTISVSAENISPKVRKLSKDEKATLINSGRIYTQYYFDKNGN